MQSGSFIARHELSITPNYVLQWREWEAVRELLQNAIDRNKRDPQSDVIFDYDLQAGEFVAPVLPKDDRRGTLVIGSTTGVLSPRSLLLGESDKQLDQNQIGQFGEGYKLAALVLCRAGHELYVHTGREIWAFTIEYSQAYDSDVLVCERSVELEEDAPERGVLFEIPGFRQEDYDIVCEKYLPAHEVDVILYGPEFKGRVFVEGLFVCKFDDLDYGYNFASSRIKLDRDRSLASTFDVSYAASDLWSKSGDNERLYETIEAGTLDTQHLATWNLPEDFREYVRDRHESTHGFDVIPVASEPEAILLESTGHQVVRVPSKLRDVLRSMHKFTFNRKGTPSERLERFRSQFGSSLTEEGKREFDAILDQSKKWKGPGE